MVKMLFELIKYHDPETTIDELNELEKQSSVEKRDEDFQPTEKIMKTSKLIKGQKLIESKIKILENIYSDEQKQQ